MLRLVTILALVALASSLAIKNAVLVSGPLPGPETFDCTGKDGYFADYYRECRIFYRCLPDGTKYTYTCILDLKFNETVHYVTCMNPDEVTCPTPSPIEV